MKKYRSNAKCHHQVWQIQEAKAEFSYVVDSAIKDGFQTITKHGKPVAVILSKEEFDRLTKPRRSLLDLFRAAPYPDFELSFTRQKDKPREIDL